MGWFEDVTKVLTMSEHNKRAHSLARKEWILSGRNNYRKYFAKYMRMSMSMNYCLESLSRKEREVVCNG